MDRRRICRAYTVAASAFALSFATVASAEPPPPDWALSIGGYGWLTASDLTVEGDLVGSPVGERDSRHFDKGLGDAFEDWDGGGGAYIDGRYMRFVGLVDGAWVQTDGDHGSWHTNTIVDAKIGYRVLDMESPFSSASGPDAPRFHLDLLAGARYRENTADVGDHSGINADEVRDWFDPVVGLRWGVDLIPHLTFQTVADIGGFDLGNASHLTWSINPRLNYRAWDHVDFFVGWKHLQDDHDGDLDVGLTGPQLGLGYSF